MLANVHVLSGTMLWVVMGIMWAMSHFGGRQELHSR